MDRTFLLFLLTLGVTFLSIGLLGWAFADESEVVIVDSFYMCALSSQEPYYDCTRFWWIFVVEDATEVCTQYENEGPPIACVDYNINFIVLQYDRLYITDPCGRGVLYHELLHTLYPSPVPSQYDIVHDYERCKMWY